MRAPNLFDELCPRAPGFELDWRSIEDALPCVREMSACPQDPHWHEEGDVGTHTRMVCEALVGSERWQQLSEELRLKAFVAALLHDVAKPACTRLEEGRYRSPGHSLRGEIMTRRLLWEMGFPLEDREEIANLIAAHQIPFYALEREDPRRLVVLLSQRTRLNLLALVAEADAQGRVCADQQRLLDNVALFEELARENDCAHAPFAFASDHSRVEFAYGQGRDPRFAVHDDTRAQVTVMSGLPASGKDTWLARHEPGLPVISLDGLRRSLKIDPRENQGRVFQEAIALAKGYLQRDQAFAWNATCLSRSLRRQLIERFRKYKARIRIVYLEASKEEGETRNRRRSAQVPQDAMERMFRKWQVPDRSEGHEVLWNS